jgi:hypothetical protein
MLKPDLPSCGDEEGAAVPSGLPLVIDTHVHVFPRALFSAVWRWFDQNAWRMRYRLTTSRVFDFLLANGVSHVISLQYAHKPGISDRPVGLSAGSNHVRLGFPENTVCLGQGVEAAEPDEAFK